MKVVISQTKGCCVDEQILHDYPVLEKYRNKMEYYTGYNDGDYDDSWYPFQNAIVINLSNDELFKIIQELTSYCNLVVGYVDEYYHQHYGVDFKIEIYDDYRE